MHYSSLYAFVLFYERMRDGKGERYKQSMNTLRKIIKAKRRDEMKANVRLSKYVHSLNQKLKHFSRLVRMSL